MVQCLDKGGALHEGQVGIRSCMNNVYTLNEILQGRFREDKETYADVQNAYGSVRCDGLWLKLWCKGEDVACN